MDLLETMRMDLDGFEWTNMCVSLNGFRG